MKKHILIIFLLLPFTLFSQNSSEIDSLLLLLNTAKEDTNQVRIYEQLFKKNYRSAPQKALEYGKIGLELAQKIEDNIGISNLSNNIGVVNYIQGNFGEALDYYRISLEIAIIIKDTLGIAKSYNNIGVVYYNISAYDEAVEYYNKSYKVREQINDTVGMAKIINNIGSLLYEKGDFDKALEYFFKALELKEKTKDFDSKAQTLLNIGAIYENREQNEEAFNFYQKALEIYEKSDNKVGIASTINSIGTYYSSKGEYKKAIEYYEKAKIIATEIEDNKRLATLQGSIAMIYIAQNEFNKAIEYFTKAKNIYLEIGSFTNILKYNLEIAKVYNSQNKPRKALPYLKECDTLIIKINGLRVKRQLYNTYYGTHKLLGDYKKALNYHEKYIDIHDSIFSDNSETQITNLQIRFDTGKKEKEIELLTKDKEITDRKIKEQRLRNQVYMLGVLGLFVIIFFIIRSNIIRRKTNIALNTKNTEINQQKEEIITQNESLIQQKEEILVQKTEIEDSHTKITASITYASRIQTAMLPTEEVLNNCFSDYFILFKPREKVSGDFYYVKRVNNYTVFAVADCTGHGVPGAFVSMLGISLLNEIVRNQEVRQASHVLDELRTQVKNSLKQTGKVKESKDGMDIALCVYDETKNKLEFAGANNHLYIVDNKNNLDVYKADRQPIGIYIKERAFKNNTIKINKNDTLYLFSDGYYDQFNGETEEKFKTRRFKELILSVSENSMQEQREIMNNTFEKWKGSCQQIDDVLVIAVKLN